MWGNNFCYLCKRSLLLSMDGPRLPSFPGMFAFLCGSTFNLYLGSRHTSKCADQMLTFGLWKRQHVCCFQPIATYIGDMEIFLYIYVGMLELSPLMQIEMQISHADCIGVLCSNLPKVDSLLCFVFRIWYFVMARFIEFI